MEDKNNGKRVVLVTGGSSGLGLAICKRLAKHGHTVYGTSRKGGSGEGFTMLPMDVTDEGSVNATVAQVLEREGHLDVVVNNAGSGIQGPVEDIDPELAARLLSTNLIGPLRVVRAVLPGMRERRSGLIINISSIAGNFGLPYRGVYSASKAGVDRLSEALRMEVEPFGIKVVVVQPGEFNTNTDANRMRPDGISEPYRAKYDRAMQLLSGSLHYSRDPDELAQVVERIINDPEPRTIYRVAKGLQRLSVVMKHLLPGHLFERLVARHYE